MEPGGSVTHWLGQLKAGDPEAAQALWERYFQRLMALARGRIVGVPRGMADEEDVALSAFDTFCRGVTDQRFPRLDDRDDLWRILVVLTVRKAGDLRDREGAQKRSPPLSGDTTHARSRVARHVDWEDVVGREPTPEFAAQMADEYRCLLARLGDQSLRQVANLKLQGYTNEEIARELECVLRTVERKLHVIRCLLQPEEES